MTIGLVRALAVPVVRSVSVATLFGATSVPALVAAAHEFPDVYGTIVTAERDAGPVTVAAVAAGAGSGLVGVDVGDLGTRPWDEGAFRIDRVVVLRTRRVDRRFVAIGWEQARDGRERVEGVASPSRS